MKHSLVEINRNIAGQHNGVGIILQEEHKEEFFRDPFVYVYEGPTYHIVFNGTIFRLFEVTRNEYEIIGHILPEQYETDVKLIKKHSFAFVCEKNRINLIIDKDQVIFK